MRGIKENPSQQPKIGNVKTDFYINSQKMGQNNQKDGGYWDSNTEMTARAFATYIMDKLPNQSDYLVGHAECAVDFDFDKDGNLTGIIKAYPEGEERKAINAVFDEIIAELKLQHYLNHDEHMAFEDKVQSHEKAMDVTNTKNAQLSFAPESEGSVNNGHKQSILKMLAKAKAQVENHTGQGKTPKNTNLEL